MNDNSKNEIKNKAEEAVNILKQDVSDEAVNENLEKLPIKNDLIKKYFVVIPAVLSLIALVLPYMSYSQTSDYTNDMAETCSGLDILFGDASTILGWLPVICPVLVILSSFISKLKPFRRVISLVCPVIALISNIAAYQFVKTNVTNIVGGVADIVNSLTSANVKISFSAGIGFYVMMLSYILTAFAGMIAYLGLIVKKK